MESFDFIIIGAGAAGLMLGKSITEDPFYRDKKILLLDKDTKTQNDRTWCFWEKGPGEFDSLLTHSWNSIVFKGKDLERDYDIQPYTYKMLEGAAFYNSFLGKLRQKETVTFKKEEVLSVVDLGDGVEVTTAKNSYFAPQAFTSIANFKAMEEQEKYPVLKQHFKGWFIKTTRPVFDPDKAVFMDFSIPQEGATRFMYVLPQSSTEALIEYTLFSEEYLPEEAYDSAIKDYIANSLRIEAYRVDRTEKGSIPMTVFDFTSDNTENLLHIGTAGGWTKPSTGYTFKNTRENVQSLIEFLKTDRPLNRFPESKRHRYYDLLLLDILYKENHKGRLIFESLFRKRSAQLIFKFLDEKTTFSEDLKIIWACPKIPFLKAAWKRII